MLAARSFGTKADRIAMRTVRELELEMATDNVSMIERADISMIGRADIEGSKNNVEMNTWLPQASYPCGNFF